MKEEIEKWINRISDFELRDLVTKIIFSSNDYFTYPAAKRNHHNYNGGLAKHSLEVTRIAMSILLQTEHDNQYSRDIIISGGLIHDIGKLIEYYVDENNEIHRNGDHMIFGTELLYRGAKRTNINPRDQRLLDLEHIIKSHHKHFDWGALEEPKTIEAEIIHAADYISSRERMKTFKRTE